MSPYSRSVEISLLHRNNRLVILRITRRNIRQTILRTFRRNLAVRAEIKADGRRPKVGADLRVCPGWVYKVGADLRVCPGWDYGKK